MIDRLKRTCYAGEVLLLLLVLGTLSVSCRKEEQNSSAIVFQALSTSYEEDTRTSYSSVVPETGDKFERIDWTEGDVIRIYCGEASLLGNSGTHYSDYTVSDFSGSGSVCTATVIPTGGNGLQWGSDEHTFYAMYPSPATTGLSGASFNNGTMVFPMPATQTVTRKEGTMTWLPDMRYAPMLAKSQAAANAASVSLAFKPQFSAYEFTVNLGGHETLHLSSFTLSSTTSNLTGNITVSAQDYETATVTGGGKSITVSLEGVTLTTASPTMTFTVLAVPLTAENLTISFTGEEIGTRTLGLNYSDGSAVSFAPYKKFRIGGITFPVLVDGSVDDPIVWDHNVSVSDYMSWYSLARVGEGLNWDNVRIALSSTVDAYLWAGETLTRTVSARDGIGAPYTDVEVYWASSATGVAKVDAVTGVVSAVAPGTATITAYAYPADGSTPLTASYTVYVNAVTEIALEIDQTEILPGNTATLTATFTHTTNGTVSAYPTISFVSGNTSIATVSPATPTPVAASESTATVTSTATAVGPGLVTLTVKSSSGYTTSVTELSASVDLKVLIPGSMGGYYLSRGVLEATSTTSLTLTSGSDPLQEIGYYWSESHIKESRRTEGNISGTTHFFSFNELGNYFDGGAISSALYETDIPTSNSTHKISYGGRQWVLPTADAWNAIFESRAGSTLNGNSGCIWASVLVNLDGDETYDDKGLSSNSSSPASETGSDYVIGVILFPDYGEFTCSSITSFNTSSDYLNTISAADVRSLCAGDAGCIFWPAVGWGYTFQSWNQVGEIGYYWSATAWQGTSTSVYVYQGKSSHGRPKVNNTSGTPRREIFPVRLICEY